MKWVLSAEATIAALVIGFAWGLCIGWAEDELKRRRNTR